MTFLEKFRVWLPLCRSPLKLFITTLNTKTDPVCIYILYVWTNSKTRSWSYLVHMKVRDETVFKPKLSHPKETRNRDGSNFPLGERNWTFSEGSCESERWGEVEGLKPAHAGWNHFWWWNAVLQVEDQGWSLCVSKDLPCWIVPSKTLSFHQLFKRTSPSFFLTSNLHVTGGWTVDDRNWCFS